MTTARGVAQIGNNHMRHSTNSPVCGCNEFVRTVRCGHSPRTLWNATVRSSLALLAIGLCHGTAGAQLTIDNPLSVYGTYLTGMDGKNVVGFYTDGLGNDHGFVYDGATFTPRDDPDGIATDPFGISGNTIVGDYYVSGNPYPLGFIYDGTGYHTLDVAGSIETDAYGVSGNNVVGISMDGFGNILSYLYDGHNFTTLSGPTGAKETVAYGITGNDIVGTYQDASGIDHGFLYDGTNYTTFSDPNATTTIFDHGTYASAIQGNMIVGSYTDPNGILHGFTYDGTSFSTIDSPYAAYGTAAWGFSDSRISGYYADSSFQVHGFIIPEPGSIALLGSLGLSILPLCRRRRRK
jgi:hypothetical protein